MLADEGVDNDDLSRQGPRMRAQACFAVAMYGRKMVSYPKPTWPAAISRVFSFLLAVSHVFMAARCEMVSPSPHKNYL